MQIRKALYLLQPLPTKHSPPPRTVKAALPPKPTPPGPHNAPPGPTPQPSPGPDPHTPHTAAASRHFYSTRPSPAPISRDPPPRSALSVAVSPAELRDWLVGGSIPPRRLRHFRRERRGGRTLRAGGWARPGGSTAPLGRPRLWSGVAGGRCVSLLARGTVEKLSRVGRGREWMGGP